MNIFDDVTFDSGGVRNTAWVEWVHWGVPDEPGLFREAARLFLFAFGHCLVCSAMDACYYASNNKPSFPYHKHCDCLNYQVPYEVVVDNFKIDFPIEKFTKYIFNKDNPQNGGKYQLFTMWGYDIGDSNYLLEQISSQAKQKFLSGDYEIRECTKYGTSIKINVVVDGRSFGTGWMILSQGKLKNTTPYASD